MNQTAMTVSGKNHLKENVSLFALFILCPPAAIFRIWRSGKNIVLKIASVLLGLPLFIVLYSFLGIVLFAAFLPPLDLTVGDRKDRTIVNSEGNYSATFLKTARETKNVYELIQTEVEPGGGNGPGHHYHKDFDEHFTVKKGALTVVINNTPHVLLKGDSITANRQTMHYFRNETDSVVVVNVKITPGKGLEKTLRVAYGLINTKQLQDGMAANAWHMGLLLGYSGTYLEGMPSYIQEPLVNSIAKIAQWKGEDKSLEQFYK